MSIVFIFICLPCGVLGDEDMEDSVIESDITDVDAAQGEPKGEKSHLIVWQVSNS